MKQRKAYLTRKCAGLQRPTIYWIAKDKRDNYIAYGNTREECEYECRKLGYTPI